MTARLTIVVVVEGGVVEEEEDKLFSGSTAAEGTGFEPAIRLLMFSHSHSSDSSS